MAAFGGAARVVLALLRRAGATPHALGVTAVGEPAHPLYLAMAARPRPFAGPALSGNDAGARRKAHGKPRQHGSGITGRENEKGGHPRSGLPAFRVWSG